MVVAVPGNGPGVQRLAQPARVSDCNAPILMPRRPLTRAKARNAALINQLGTPGLGSLMAGRYAVGIGQLIVFLAGFCLFVAWFFRVMLLAYQQFNGGAEAQLKPVAWMAEAGVALAALAWFWSLFTSINLLRQAKPEKPTE
jgi:hypothetical protein